MAKQKERPVNVFDVVDNFTKREKKICTKKKEYHGMGYGYGRSTGNGAFYQTRSNPFKKLSADEVKIRKGVASYFFWGRLIAKYDGKNLWLSDGKCESVGMSRKLTLIYSRVMKLDYAGRNVTQAITNSFEEAKDSDYDKRIQFLPEGYTLGRSTHIINSYPITVSKATGEITDFSEEQRKMYLTKYLRSRGPRGGFILSTIEAFNFSLSKEEQASIKAKQLKLFMDNKTGQGSEKDNFLSNTLAII